MTHPQTNASSPILLIFGTDTHTTVFSISTVTVAWIFGKTKQIVPSKKRRPKCISKLQEKTTSSILPELFSMKTREGIIWKASPTSITMVMQMVTS